MKVTKVTMFKSTDGQLHSSSDACKQHEAHLEVEPKVKALLLEQMHGAGSEDEVPSLTASEVAAWVSNNATVLFELLSPLQPKKPRVPRNKPGAAATPPVPPKATPDAASQAGQETAKQDALDANPPGNPDASSTPAGAGAFDNLG